MADGRDPHDQALDQAQAILEAARLIYIIAAQPVGTNLMLARGNVEDGQAVLFMREVTEAFDAIFPEQGVKVERARPVEPPDPRLNPNEDEAILLVASCLDRLESLGFAGVVVCANLAGRSYHWSASSLQKDTVVRLLRDEADGLERDGSYRKMVPVAHS